MRPDGLEQANTPRMDALIAEGASTLNARTVMPSVTLPCHQSLFRSVTPERHGITTNTFMPLARPVPSLIDVVHASKGTTASFYNWEQLRDLSDPGALTASFFLKNCHRPTGDVEVAELAADYLAKNPTTFAFIYLGFTDIAGHGAGWMSEPYLTAIENADACIGTVLDALREAGRLDETLVIVTADHGGHGQSHGTMMDEDMLIPWIAWGAGVPKGITLSDPVEIIDTPPTVAAYLGIEASEEWRGRVVPEIAPTA